MNNLSQIKDQLLARRADLEHRRDRVARDLERQHDPLVADFADQATQRQNDDALRAIGGAADEEIAAIDTALRRLAAGSYGICNQCQHAIEPERLAAVPYAVNCTACAGLQG